MTDDLGRVAAQLPQSAESFDGALEALAATYPGVFDLAWLARTLHADELDGVAPCIAGIMKRGRLVEAAALAETVVQLSKGRPRVQWLQPKTALQCVMKLYQLGAHDDATRDAVHAAMDELVAWRERWVDPARLDAEAELHWAWIEQLRALPLGFPQPLLNALLAGAGSGELANARPAVAAYAAQQPTEARSMRGVLLAHAPHVDEAVGFLLMPAEERVHELVAETPRTVPGAAHAGFAKAAPGTVERLRDTSGELVDAVTRQLGDERSPVRTWLAIGVVIVVTVLGGVWLLTDRRPQHDAAVDPEQELLTYAAEDLCEYLEAESGCVFARQVSKSLAHEDCAAAREPMRSLERQVRGTEGFDEYATEPTVVQARGALGVLVGRFKELCLDE